MKRLFVLSLLSLMAVSVQAQDRSAASQGNNRAGRVFAVRGRVLSGGDSTVLHGAMVSITPGSQFALSQETGNFSVAGVPVTATSVVISYLGHEIRTLELKPTGKDVNLGDIYLEQKAGEIEAVTVEAKAVMAVQKGDTTQFNAAAFKVTTDADADGLIAKMPGMVIENGKVEAQGEEVKKVYVDGKLWMGDDPMSTLKNIPADAVESVEMFDEKSDMAKFTGFDDGQTARALNIVTKAKQNKAVIARSEESLGTNIGDDIQKTLYQVNNSYTLFAEKHRVGANFNLNNLGNSNSGRGFNMADGGSTPTGNRKVLNTGFFYAFENKKLKASVNYTFNRNANSGWSDTETNNFTNYRYSHDYNSSSSLNRGHHVNLMLEWNPSDRHRIIFRPSVNFSDASTARISSEADVNILDRETMQKLDSISKSLTYNASKSSSFSMDGNLTWMFRMNDKGTSLVTNVGYSLSNSTSRNTPNRIYDLEWDNVSEEWKRSTADRENPRERDSYDDNVNARISLLQPLSTKHRIKIDVSASTGWSNNTSNAYTFDASDNRIPDLRQSAVSDRNSLTLGAGLGYSFNNRQGLTMNVTLGGQRISQKKTSDLPYESTLQQHYFAFRPHLGIEYKADNRSFRFNYSGESQLPGLDQMMDFYDISSSGRRITIGNPDLKQGYSHSVRMHYRSANTEKSTYFNVGLNLSARNGYVASDMDYIYADTTLYVYGHEGDPEWAVKPQYGASVTRYVNMDGQYSGNLRVGYSFPLNAIKSNINLSAGYGLSRTPSLNAEATPVKGEYVDIGGTQMQKYEVFKYKNILLAHNIHFRVGIASNISEKVDFNINYRTNVTFNLNTYKNNNTYLRQNLSYTMNFILPLDFTLTSTANWSYNKNYGLAASKGADNSYVLFNVGIGKKFFKNKSGEFRITAYDLFNQNRSYTHTVSENYVRDSRTDILGRYILARFSFRFNSMRGNMRQSESMRRGQRPEFGDRVMRPGDGGFPGQQGGFPGGGGGFPGGGGGFGGGRQ